METGAPRAVRGRAARPSPWRAWCSSAGAGPSPATTCSSRGCSSCSCGCCGEGAGLRRGGRGRAGVGAGAPSGRRGRVRVGRSPVPSVCGAFPGLVLPTARGAGCCYSPHFTAAKLRAEEVGVPGRQVGTGAAGHLQPPSPPAPAARALAESRRTPSPPESHGPGICFLGPRRPPAPCILPARRAGTPGTSRRTCPVRCAIARLSASLSPVAAAASRQAWRGLPCLSCVGSGGSGSGP